MKIRIYAAPAVKGLKSCAIVASVVIACHRHIITPAVVIVHVLNQVQFILYYRSVDVPWSRLCAVISFKLLIYQAHQTFANLTFETFIPNNSHIIYNI